MSSFLPVANKTVVIGSSDFQSLLDGVKLVYVGLTKKEDTENTPKSKKQNSVLFMNIVYTFHINDFIIFI